LKTIGDRITYCRSTIGLTRKELSELWGEASVPTLSRWELDNIEPTQKKLALISEFFCSKGLIVSPNWIHSGEGISPSLLNMKEFAEDDFDDICEQNFLTLNQKIKNFSYYKVTSNFFSPTMHYGDYVGGIKIESDISSNANSLVFVVHENAVHVGFLEYNGTPTLKNLQGKTMSFPNYSFMAKIHWMAIRP
jgi:transcriptional regulator with XRE-family HTH domain